jgi:hypothetical protein
MEAEDHEAKASKDKHDPTDLAALKWGNAFLVNSPNDNIHAGWIPGQVVPDV